MTSGQEYRDISGILLLDKPHGMSSNQAMQKARYLFRARKAGHTGSLDPLATGMLPICFGEATKIAGHLLGARKAYSAECRLGVTTTSDDAEGEVVATRAVPAIDAAALEAAMQPLRGRIMQTAPIYSALKQGGVPLYKRARRGEDVEAPTRTVEVFRLDAVAHADDALRLYVECGSGTYVRSLARDLGEKLGCGAHLTALRRLWVEPFREPAMHTWGQLEAVHAERGPDGLDALLLSLDEGLVALPALHLSPEEAIALRHGRRLRRVGIRTATPWRALDADNRLVALVEADANGDVRVLRGFNAAVQPGSDRRIWI
ncbi:MAG: tRNA pseudouridine(55) synthase TruB [Rudaea sp.]|uniref:tRNA pseudouridine(55) synthase TruB n=1 Tax=Rudaea sp. TaxID=2136325 RepID=UPI0039E4FC9D